MILIKTITLLTVMILFSACFQDQPKVPKKAAEIAISDVKTILVYPFYQDHTNITGIMRETLSKATVEGTPLFNVVTLKATSKAIEQAQLTPKAYFTYKSLLKVAHTTKSDAVLFGSIDETNSTEKITFKDRTRCKEGRCWSIKVMCKQQQQYFVTTLNLLNVKDQKLIYKEQFKQDQVWYHCADDNNTIPSTLQAKQILAQKIAKKFLVKLIPEY